MYTLVVGKGTDTGRCRLLTMAEKADEPKLVDLPAKYGDKNDMLQIPCPKWANYVKGTIAFYRGKPIIITHVLKILSQNSRSLRRLITFCDGENSNTSAIGLKSKVYMIYTGESHLY